MAVPLTTGRSGLDRDATLLLLLHEIGGSFTVVNFACLVNLACELQDTLGGSSFARINVGKYPDVAVIGKVSHLVLTLWEKKARLYAVFRTLPG